MTFKKTRLLAYVNPLLLTSVQKNCVVLDFSRHNKWSFDLIEKKTGRKIVQPVFSESRVPKNM